MARQLRTMRSFHPSILSILWSRSLAKPHEKLNMLFLHFTKTNNHQTWQNGDLLWAASSQKVTWPCHRVVLKSYITNQKHYISSATMLIMTTKFSRVVTYLEDLLPIKSHEPFITWPCEIMWQIKNIFVLGQCLRPLDAAG